MYKYPVLKFVAVNAVVGLFAAGAFAQERPAQVKPAAPAQEQAQVQQQVPDDPPADYRGVVPIVASPARPANVSADAVTPAADISSGTFGANTGGGEYRFPTNVGFNVVGGLRGLVHMQNGGLFYESILDAVGVYGLSYMKARGTPAAKTIVNNGDSTGFLMFMGYDGSTYQQSSSVRGWIEGAPGVGSMPGALTFSTTPSGSVIVQERMRITSAGNVGIGTAAPTAKLHVVGNATFTGTVTGGNIAATYQDVAEWVPANENLEAGSVVVLNPEKSNEVMLSHNPYDTRVAGVVSAQPGVALGIPDANKELIATTGRVKVRVDASKGAIAVGDLLVTSEKPGIAMRSEPMEINGRKFHQPGTIVGKALEPLANGQGEILVLLSLQ